MSKTLKNPPENKENRELWLQNVAGVLIFNNIREYAISRINKEITKEQKSEIIKGIDDAIYGLMMMMDGVTGELKNEKYSVRIEHKIILEEYEKRILELNTLNSDGMCMGFHAWKENDFGEFEIFEE
ncbi:MAG: hypothetical protein KGV59_05330 [Tenacibaculum sp.]|nr:hypothetical protein [Tenacibaculum sp.]